MAYGTWPRLVLIPLWAAVASAAVGCGGGGQDGTPEGALQALAEAVNASDDKAIAALICSEARVGSESIAEARAMAVQADPELAGLRYEARPGPVTDKTDTTAVGTMTITVHGVPDDLSQEGQQFLSVVQAPRPISLMREDDRINLVKRDGVWQVCK